MEKFKNRKEQREITEIMNEVLLPLLKYINTETAIKIRKEVYENHNCNEPMEVWGDNIVFDWVLFCKLYGHLYNVPEYIGLVPLDMCVLFKLKFGVPYVVREDYLGIGIRGREKKYNALNDALVIKACYEKLMNDMEVK